MRHSAWGLRTNRQDQTEKRVQVFLTPVLPLKNPAHWAMPEALPTNPIPGQFPPQHVGNMGSRLLGGCARLGDGRARVFRVLRAVRQLVLILRSCLNPSTCSAPGSDYAAQLRDANLISAALQRPNHICKGGGRLGAPPLRAWSCPATPHCPPLLIGQSHHCPQALPSALGLIVSGQESKPPRGRKRNVSQDLASSWRAPRSDLPNLPPAFQSRSLFEGAVAPL